MLDKLLNLGVQISGLKKKKYNTIKDEERHLL